VDAAAMLAAAIVSPSNASVSVVDDAGDDWSVRVEPDGV
jgi:hypothetical protein